MSTGNTISGMNTVDPGVIIGSAPRWGERASMIRYIATKYPELSQGDIARRVGCSHQNVSEVLAEFLADTSPERVDQFRENKATICEALQHKLLASITQDNLDKTPAVSLITGFAILQDKIQLMRGQPTSIHVTALVDLVQVLRERRNEQE